MDKCKKQFDPVDIVRHFFPDIILGANDGIITTFAVVAATHSSGLGAMVAIALGLANLFADGVSMGASNYIAQRSRNRQHHNCSKTNSIYHGLATFVGFMIAGFLPLITYLLPFENRFPWAIVITATALFTVGAARVIFTKAYWLKAGFEMLSIGTLASVAAYVVGLFFHFG